jgi:hypothetical protein
MGNEKKLKMKGKLGRKRKKQQVRMGNEKKLKKKERSGNVKPVRMGEY